MGIAVFDVFLLVLFLVPALLFLGLVVAAKECGR